MVKWRSESLQGTYTDKLKLKKKNETLKLENNIETLQSGKLSIFYAPFIKQTTEYIAS